MWKSWFAERTVRRLRTIILVPAGLMGLAAAAGCSPTVATSADPVQPRLIGGAIRIGGCPQINIGTPQNPRIVKDPACGAGQGR